jgi:hypothetical protein
MTSRRSTRPAAKRARFSEILPCCRGRCAVQARYFRAGTLDKLNALGLCGHGARVARATRANLSTGLSFDERVASDLVANSTITVVCRTIQSHRTDPAALHKVRLQAHDPLGRGTEKNRQLLPSQKRMPRASDSIWSSRVTHCFEPSPVVGWRPASAVTTRARTMGSPAAPAVRAISARHTPARASDSEAVMVATTRRGSHCRLSSADQYLRNSSSVRSSRRYRAPGAVPRSGSNTCTGA